jgi:hypothetical protein
VSEAIYTNALSLDRLLAYGQPMSYGIRLINASASWAG